MKTWGLRTRLIAANTVVVFVLLIGSSAALLWTTRTLLLRSFDNDLERMVRPMGPGRGPGPMPRMGMQGPDPGRPGPEQQDQGGLERPRRFGRDGHPFEQESQEAPADKSAFTFASHGTPTFANVVFNHESYRVLLAPMRGEDGAIMGVVQVGHRLTDIDRLTHTQLQVLLFMLPAALILAGLSAAYLADRSLKPIQQITEAAERVSDSDLEALLPVEQDDEIGRLAGSFNRMVARLKDAFAIRDAANAKLTQSLEQQKRFTADASHELRTPLTRIRITADVGEDDTSPEELRKSMGIIKSSADEMTSLITELLALARSDSGTLIPGDELLDAADLVSSAVSASASSGGPIPIIEGATGRVRASRDHLIRALSNLIINAKKHSPGDVPPTISAEFSPLNSPSSTLPVDEGGLSQTAGAFVRFTVSDHGPGIAPEHLPNLGKRFYRVEEDRSRESGGFGLGLAIAKEIAELYGGFLEIESKLGKGTKVHLTLPAV